VTRGASALREGLLALADEGDRFLAGLRERAVELPTPPAVVVAEVARRFPLDAPMPLGRLVREAAELLGASGVQVTHPRYFGLFNPSVSEAAVVGDAVAALWNPQLATWSHATAALAVERHVLARLAALLGIEAPAAHFTSGGAEANLTAALAALARAFPAWADEGVRALAARPVLYGSSEAHGSLVKIARMTGLGAGAVRSVPARRDLAMDVDALARRMEDDAAAGLAPFLVVATAGTTAAGAVDPLRELAAAARDRGAWLHVDAAYGGLAALSPRLAPCLDGIARADSVTWDAHKTLDVPMAAGMFFCRHPEALARAFGVSASYMPPPGGELDPYVGTAQWSRRAIGMKVLFSLAEAGLDGHRARVERQARLADALRGRLAAAGWELANATPLPVVCFTHADVRSGRVAAGALAAALQRGGRAWISEAIVRGERVLRACITSAHTEEEDVAALVEEVERARRGG
jgi:aromatic-L-amino-acid decarboxylase